MDELVSTCRAGVVAGRDEEVVSVGDGELVCFDETDVETGEPVAFTVDTLVLPEIVVLGCTSTGTTKTRVAPSSSVVVLVTVVVYAVEVCSFSDSVF